MHVTCSSCAPDTKVYKPRPAPSSPARPAARGQQLEATRRVRAHDASAPPRSIRNLVQADRPAPHHSLHAHALPKPAAVHLVRRARHVPIHHHAEHNATEHAECGPSAQCVIGMLYAAAAPSPCTVSSCDWFHETKRMRQQARHPRSARRRQRGPVALERLSAAIVGRCSTSATLTCRPRRHTDGVRAPPRSELPPSSKSSPPR